MFTCTHVHMYTCSHVQYNVHPNVHISIGSDTSTVDNLCCNVRSVFFWEHAYVPYMCHICAIWTCAMWKCAICASAAAAGADETKVLQHSKNQPPPISTSSFLASHQHPTFSTKRKPLKCWIDTFVLHIISVVTYGSFNMLGGILNHDIFLFVPNISSKALPWKISAEYQFEFNLT